MRLIDADVFIDFIRNLPKEPNGFSKSYDESVIVRFVENQPTAYDVEAKVAELEKTKNECEPMYGGRSCGKEAKAIYAMALSYAISIVRGKE